MYGLAVGEKHHAEVALLLSEEYPPAHSPVRLDRLGVGSGDRTRNPLVENARAVGPLAGIPKVLGCLEDTRILSVRLTIYYAAAPTARPRPNAASLEPPEGSLL